MIPVRIRPAAPTRDPPDDQGVVWTTKPVAEAARPEREFKKEITTGMSPPPMGTTSSTPSRQAPRERPVIRAQLSGATISATLRRRHQEQQAFPEVLAGQEDVLPHDPGQLADGDQAAGQRHPADQETHADRDREHDPAQRPGLHGRQVARESLGDRHQRRCGPPEAVEGPDHLGHARHLNAHGHDAADQATQRQTAEDQSPADAAFSSACIFSRVTRTATSMPKAPIMLPRGAVFGDERNFSPKMKQAAATR